MGRRPLYPSQLQEPPLQGSVPQFWQVKPWFPQEADVLPSGSHPPSLLQQPAQAPHGPMPAS
jgi:hypothetical protein